MLASSYFITKAGVNLHQMGSAHTCFGVNLFFYSAYVIQKTHLLFVSLANSADHDFIEKIKVSHGFGILQIEEGVLGFRLEPCLSRII